MFINEQYGGYANEGFDEATVHTVGQFLRKYMILSNGIQDALAMYISR